MHRHAPVTRDDLPPAAWSNQIRIRSGHCDATGMVYTPRFFDLFNRAVEEWFNEALKVNYHELITQRRIGLAYAQASSEFYAPTLMGDKLEFFPLITRIGTGSVSFSLHALKNEREVAHGEFVMVTTSLDTHKVIPLPADLKKALVRYEAACAESRTRVA